MTKTTRKILVSYSKIARVYNIMNQLFFFGKDKKYRSMLAERLIEKPNENLLVLCCGTGIDFPILIQKKYNQGKAQW